VRNSLVGEDRLIIEVFLVYAKVIWGRGVVDVDAVHELRGKFLQIQNSPLAMRQLVADIPTKYFAPNNFSAMAALKRSGFLCCIFVLVFVLF